MKKIRRTFRNRFKFGALICLVIQSVNASIMLLCSTNVIYADTQELAPSVRNSFKTELQSDHIDIYLGSDLVTTYWFLSGRKPILWPLLSPKGFKLTRDYPMSHANPSEVKDHLHHRSLWVTHGEVNDVNFWTEEGKNLGTIVQEQIEIDDSDANQVSLQAKNNWVDDQAKVVMREATRIVIRRTEMGNELDFAIEWIAGDESVHLGDTKEGTFGIRVAESMRVEANLGGRILTSDGMKNKDAWGQASQWVDYSGPVQLPGVSDVEEGSILKSDDGVVAVAKGESDKRGGWNQAGITLFVHPQSFQAPGRWHVRDYGLFAHNPFGVKDFAEVVPVTSDARTTGGFTILPNQSIRLRYLVILHDDQWTPEQAEKRYTEFAKE